MVYIRCDSYSKSWLSWLCSSWLSSFTLGKWWNIHLSTCHYHFHIQFITYNHNHIQCCNMRSLESIIKCLRWEKQSMCVCLCVCSVSHVPLGRKHRDHSCSRVTKATTGEVQVVDMCTVPKGTCSISCMEMAEMRISPASVISWLWTICAKWTFCVWVMINDSHMLCWSNETVNSQFYHDIAMMLLKAMHGVLFTFYTPLSPWRYTLHPI